MDTFNILHITDLHIDEPNSINEKLRIGFYKDYISSLFNTIENYFSIKIDYLVCTGDIINRGKTENFSHARKIFEFLQARGRITKENTFINIGNHDLTLIDDKKGNKQDFYSFVNEYTTPKQSELDLFHIKNFDNHKISFCLFDSIFNENQNVNAEWATKTIKPSQLSPGAIDSIVNQIDEKVPKDFLLIIACHFPMMISSSAEMYTEQENWVEKHLWKSGKIIAKRLIDRRPYNSTFFLFGDGHLPDFWDYNANIRFFMTGMFGGDYLHTTYKDGLGETHAYNKTNQAKLFRFKNDHSIESISTLNYVAEGFALDSQTGKWEIVNTTKLRLDRKNNYDIPKEKKEFQPQKATTKRDVTSTPLISPQSNPIQLISTHIQREILNEIKIKHLYTIARTTSSNVESSLGYLPINLLFQKTELLSRCVDKGLEWLSENIADGLDPKTTIIVGVGFWGAIIGSQMSVRLDIRNICISSNLSATKNNAYESLNNLCGFISDHPGIKKVIVISDVISTGNSIIKIKNTVESKCGQREFWAAMSVIGDKKQSRTTAISQYQLLGSFCIDLPIPIIRNEFLPDESIFPIEYDYR